MTAAPPPPDADSARLAALASAWREPMLRFACLHLHPPEEAEDAVQDALLALLNADMPDWARESEAAARPYVFGILKHKITDRLRAKYRPDAPGHQPLADDEGIDELLFDGRGHWYPGLAPARWDGPEGQLQSHQFLAVVDACVQKLPPKAARVFTMKELLDCDADEICATLGISRADYWQSMSRARKQLQICLHQHWFGQGDTR